MFDILVDLQMDLQFYLLLASAMLSFSFIVFPYVSRTYDSSSLTKNRSIYESDIINKLLYKDLPINTILIFIVTCIKLKESPNGDNDDHPLLLIT